MLILIQKNNYYSEQESMGDCKDSQTSVLEVQQGNAPQPFSCWVAEMPTTAKVQQCLY